MERSELESLKRGLDYFKENGVLKVALQPKYMGSRCNIYLHPDVEHCFAVSRNGYKIKQVDLTDVYHRLLARFGPYMQEWGIRMLILDGELMPWNALGEGLIQRQFKPIGKALEGELSFLRNHGFETALQALTEQYRASGFEQDQYRMPKKALSDKYGASVYQNYKHMHEIVETSVPLAQHAEAYETYKRQLDLYAEAGEMEYKPFAILKIVFENGDEELPTTTGSRISTGSC